MVLPAFDSLSVLVVDDNRFMQEILSTMLKALGIHRVLRVEDSIAALEAMETKEFDFLMVDIEMQTLDGVEFTRLVRCSKDSPNPYIPVIIVSGHTNRRIVEEARDAGMTEFLAKPITAQMLCRRIEEIIERPRPFIRTHTYCGPDRRRHDRPSLNQGRRAQDRGLEPEILYLEEG